MTDRPMYHEHSRALQDQFDTRRLADRLDSTLAHSQFKDEDRAFIEARSFFFLATTDADGFPECSYKGGAPGFVRVIDEQTLAFPSYDGNGMFKSLGNIRASNKVGLLFLDFEQPKRLRVNGLAVVSDKDPLLQEYVGAQLMVHVQTQQIFPDCPRYIHRMQIVKLSMFIPQVGVEAPIPKWKTFPQFNEVLPVTDPARVK
ncbi:MAG: pyridoxamine 5'-phosphate oxidase family protein [Candidatus Obscuribacterales bacterium]|nr:pyridoxamine 5'-phosphate oxidase family protein [Steroidobacteraceae bacterium]